METKKAITFNPDLEFITTKFMNNLSFEEAKDKEAYRYCSRFCHSLKAGIDCGVKFEEFDRFNETISDFRESFKDDYGVYPENATMQIINSKNSENNDFDIIAVNYEV